MAPQGCGWCADCFTLNRQISSGMRRQISGHSTCAAGRVTQSDGASGSARSIRASGRKSSTRTSFGKRKRTLGRISNDIQTAMRTAACGPQARQRRDRPQRHWGAECAAVSAPSGTASTATAAKPLDPRPSVSRVRRWQKSSRPRVGAHDQWSGEGIDGGCWRNGPHATIRQIKGGDR